VLVALVLVALSGWVLGTATGDEPRTQPPPPVTATSTEAAEPTPEAPPAATSRVDGGGRRIAVSHLPPEARETLRLIEADGPFPYDRDGAVFENRERILPRAARGYYREYTVETPGSRDRGARRIVRGARGETYYTDDHYASFRQVAP
jgi:ribonuclease T1